MSTDASFALGAPQLAGTFVNPKGFARQATAAVAAGAVGRLVATATTPAQDDIPKFGRVAFVAATADEIAILKTKSGLLKMKVTDQVLAHRARTELSAAELKRGAFLSGLSLQFSDGSAWTFDVPKANQKTAIQLVEALGGTIKLILLRPFFYVRCGRQKRSFEPARSKLLSCV